MQIFAINKMDKRQDTQLANGQMMMIGIQLLHLWDQIDDRRDIGKRSKMLYRRGMLATI